MDHILCLYGILNCFIAGILYLFMRSVARDMVYEFILAGKKQPAMCRTWQRCLLFYSFVYIQLDCSSISNFIKQKLLI